MESAWLQIYGHGHELGWLKSADMRCNPGSVTGCMLEMLDSLTNQCLFVTQQPQHSSSQTMRHCCDRVRTSVGIVSFVCSMKLASCHHAIL